MENQNSQHIDVLDSLRAFAALSVCAFHFICKTTGFIKSEWVLSFFEVGQYGVHTFFVISGFIIPWSMFHANYEIKNFFKFFLKRLSRLEPPYLFSLLVAIILLVIRSKFYAVDGSEFTLNFKQIFLHLGYLIPFSDGYKWLNVVYWTLAVEFQYYLFIAIVFVFLVKSTLFSRIIIYCGVVALSWFTHREFLCYWLPIFFLGILLFLKMSKIIANKEYYMVTMAFIAISFYKYHFALVLFSVLPVIAILYFKDIKVILLNFLGKFSYSIYLIHALIGATFINVASHYCTNVLAKIGVLIGGLALSIVASWITYLIIEKPSKKLSARIKY